MLHRVSNNGMASLLQERASGENAASYAADIRDLSLRSRLGLCKSNSLQHPPTTMLATSISTRSLFRQTLYTNSSISASLVNTQRLFSRPTPSLSLSSTATRSITSTMPPKNAKNGSQNGNGEEKQTSQGHTLKEPPNSASSIWPFCNGRNMCMLITTLVYLLSPLSPTAGWKGPIPAQNGGREEGYLQKVR